METRTSKRLTAFYTKNLIKFNKLVELLEEMIEYEKSIISDEESLKGYPGMIQSEVKRLRNSIMQKEVRVEQLAEQFDQIQAKGPNTIKQLKEEEKKLIGLDREYFELLELTNN